MRVASALLRGGAVFLSVVAFFCSFVDTFVTVSFDMPGYSDSFGTDAWEEFGAAALILTFAAIATSATAFGIGLARQSAATRVLDILTIAALGLSIVLLIVLVPRLRSDVDGIPSAEFGVGWSGYVIFAVQGIAVLLMIVATLLPVRQVALPTTAGWSAPGAPPAPGFADPSHGWGYPGAQQVDNQKALWSMILGIVSFACCAPVTSIVAIVLAVQAKREIAASAGTQTGEGKAQAGLVLGIISTVLACVALVFYAVVLIAM